MALESIWKLLVGPWYGSKWPTSTLEWWVASNDQSCESVGTPKSVAFAPFPAGPVTATLWPLLLENASLGCTVAPTRFLVSGCHCDEGGQAGFDDCSSCGRPNHKAPILSHFGIWISPKFLVFDVFFANFVCQWMFWMLPIQTAQVRALNMTTRYDYSSISDQGQGCSSCR